MDGFIVRMAEKDSVLSLCRRFSVSAERLIRENLLKSELKEGALVYISRRAKYVHIAEAGESYQSIAAKYKKSEEELKKINGAEYVFYSMPVVIEE